MTQRQRGYTQLVLVAILGASAGLYIAYQHNQIEALQTARAKTEQAAIDAASAATLAKDQTEKNYEDQILHADADARGALDRYALAGDSIRRAAVGLRNPAPSRNSTPNMPIAPAATPSGGAAATSTAIAVGARCDRTPQEDAELRAAAADLADLLADTHRAAVAYGARTGQLEAAWPQQGDAP